MHWAKSGGDLSVPSEFTADFLPWICEAARQQVTNLGELNI